MDKEGCTARQSDTENELGGLRDVLAKDSVSTVSAKDPGEEYYLFRMTPEGPEKLTKRTMDTTGLYY